MARAMLQNNKKPDQEYLLNKLPSKLDVWYQYTKNFLKVLYSK